MTQSSKPAPEILAPNIVESSRNRRTSRNLKGRGRPRHLRYEAPPGYQIVAADYSEIELRIIAHIPQDPALIKPRQGLPGEDAEGWQGPCVVFHKLPVNDEEGNFSGVLAMATEITRETDIFQHIIDALPVLLFWTDRNHVIIGINLQHAKAFVVRG